MENVNTKIWRFRSNEQVKETVVICVRFICMGLFLYTAYAKIIDHDRFLTGLLKVHIINGFAVCISYAVPIIEIIVALLLLIPRTANWGLFLFTAVMFVFTIYITSALILEKHLPCNCGGAIEKLSWLQHIWFNLAFISIAIFASWLNKSKKVFKNYIK